MNDEYVELLMPHIRKWTALPVWEAKEEMLKWMRRHDKAQREYDPAFEGFEHDGFYSPLDYRLVEVSETIEEAIGCVFGI